MNKTVPLLSKTVENLQLYVTSFCLQLYITSTRSTCTDLHALHLLLLRRRLLEPPLLRLARPLVRLPRRRAARLAAVHHEAASGAAQQARDRLLAPVARFLAEPVAVAERENLEPRVAGNRHARGVAG